MSAPAEKLPWPPENPTSLHASHSSDRRADIEAKQALISSVLEANECEGLLVLDPDNFPWLTSGGAARGVLDPAETPGLYFSPDQRWVICANTDSQRIFDEEINGLGFQLKEWPWHWGREQLLADLRSGRKLASDVPFGDCKNIGDQLRERRRVMTQYDSGCLRALGRLVAHALEATCRTINRNQTERETAGQIGHRLLHRGAQPVAISVAADGRSRLYRHVGFTLAPISRSCVAMVTARKYGLCVTASRAMSFGLLDEADRAECDAACKVTGAYVAATWPDAMPREILSAGRRVYTICGFEHEWRNSPQGHVTGRVPVEMALTPHTEQLLHASWVITWRSAIGAAESCDTYMVSEEGPELITPTENWPLKRIRFQGVDFLRPFPLERTEGNSTPELPESNAHPE